MNYFKVHHHEEFIKDKRILALEWAVFLFILLVIVRLFYLQILQHDKYLGLAKKQHQSLTVVMPERGEIFALADNKDATNLYPLAVNQIFYQIYVDPEKISRPQNVADILSSVFTLDKKEILTKLQKTDDNYELIVKKASQEQLTQLQTHLDNLLTDANKDKAKKDQLKTMGVYWQKETLRFYPDKEVGAQILGFLAPSSDGLSQEGKYGLEAYWQEKLAGSGEKILTETDNSGRTLLFSDWQSKIEDGADLILTIDKNIQYQTCKALEKSVLRHGAQTGTVIVMETATGAIRAMCNFPSFDPNQYNEVENIDVYNNLAVYHNYEPGSVMKAISMAIAIDLGQVNANTTYNDTGEVKFGTYTIQNSDKKAHGTVNMTEVLVSSLNTGVVFATKDIRNKIYYEYLEKFGFGTPVGLKISQEGQGNISSLKDHRDIYRATASYGQGVTVTPLQMLNAFNVIANSGNLVQPYLIKEVKYSDGVQEKFEPKILRRVLKETTASTLKGMLVQVVETGHSRHAAVPGYYVAGKTGTAEVADTEHGGYFHNKNIHNFIGFAPADGPKFTILTKLDYPTSAPFAESTAAPLFSEIAKFLLEYYQIAPTR